MPRNSAFQALRGLAALAVLAEHTLYFASITSQTGYQGVFKLPILGAFGVYVFFCLSGYLMGAAYEKGLDKSFLAKRFLRIYPPLWVAIGLSLLLAAFQSRVWTFDWFAALLIPWPTYGDTFDIPYWTLVYEVVFYSCVYALMFIRQWPIARSMPVVWVAIIAIVHVAYGYFNHVHPGYAILLSPMNNAFVAGFVCGAARLKLPERFPVSLASVLVVALFGAQIGLLGIEPLVASYCGAAGGLLAVLAAASRGEAPRLLSRLGDASYGIYLIHFMLLFTGMNWFAATFPKPPAFVSVPVLFAFALGGGWVFGALEHKAHAVLSARVFRRPGVAETPAQTGPARPD